MKNKFLIVFCLISFCLFALNYSAPQLFVNAISSVTNEKTSSNTNDKHPSKKVVVTASVSKEFKADIIEGIIGVGSNSNYDDAYDNVFHIKIDELPTSEEQIFLEYELYGYAFSEAISRSVNNNPSIGGRFITKNSEWTQQQEQLNTKLIVKGNNVVLFTNPVTENNIYKIKNLKIVYRKASQISKYTLLKYNNKFYIKGLIAQETQSLQVGDYSIPTNQGEFELEITNPFTQLQIEEKLASGAINKQLFLTSDFTEVSSYSTISNANKKVTGKLSSAIGVTYNYNGLSVNFPVGSVKEDKVISIRGLRKNDIAPLNSSMVNVTNLYAGYRMLPHGSLFEKAATLEIEFDKKKIPEGYTEKDITVFYFDEFKRLWKEVPKDTLYSQSTRIVAKTNHFTDFIAGIIKLPESPETSGYTPTSIKDLKAASPLVGIAGINPPSSNPNGTANTSFPIQLPGGRNGMQPSLAIHYSSEGGHSWAGLGWDISLPAVTIETRWGAPRYDATKETESYAIAGEDLLPNAHRDQWLDRTADKQFFPRKEGGFQKIIRKGSSPSNYYWQVTDKSGVISYYGGTSAGLDENGILRTETGNIGHWCLLQQTNLRGNSIHYEYDKIEGQLYIKKIYYTGFNNSKGLYTVTFIKDSELGEPQRPDVQVNARTGFKQTNNKLLRKIEVKFKNQKVRSYQLNYVLGAFKKTLLKEIAVYDSQDALFYTNKLEYYNDVVDASGQFKPFGDAQFWTVPQDNLGNNILGVTNPLFSGHHTLAGSSNGSSKGINYRIGVGSIDGLGSFKGNTVGGHGGNSWGKSETAILLEDLDGDQLPDKVITKDGKVYYRKNLSYLGQNAFGDLQEININNLGITKSTSFNFGVDLTLSYGANLNLGYDQQYGTNKTKSYFMDFNGDGLVDFVNNGQVYYNRLVAGVPTFISSSTGTPSPVSNFGSLQLTGSSSILTPEEILSKNPLHDIVRMWEAPETGSISVTHNYALLEDTSSERAEYLNNTGNDKADGVHLYFQKANQLIWEETITATDYSLKNRVNTTLTVNKGDKLYFRVSSILDGNYDKVSWEPIITYNEVNDYIRLPNGSLVTNLVIVNAPSNDANNFSLKEYTIDTDFFSSTKGYAITPSAYNVAISGVFNKPVTSDHILLKVIKKNAPTAAVPVPVEFVVFEKQFLANEIAAFDFSTIPAINLEALAGLRIALESETTINWQTISLNPSIAVPQGANPALEIKKLEVSHYMYRKRQGNYLQNGITTTFDSSSNLTLSVNPLDYNLNDPQIIPLSEIAEYNGDVVYTVKQNNKIVARTRYKLINGILSLNQLPIDIQNVYNLVEKDIPLHTEVFVSNTKSLVLLKSYPKTNSLYVTLKTQYIVTNPDGSTQVINWSANTDEYAIYSELEIEESRLGQYHRNWGGFVVNGTLVNSSTINEALLQSSPSYQAEPDISNAPDQNSDAYTIANEYFVRITPVFSKNTWFGLEESIYISFKEMGTSRLGEDDVAEYLDFDLPTVQGGSTVALEMINESKSRSVSAGLGYGAVNGGASKSNGETYVTQTMSDFNGDRFPDYVRNQSVQYTTPLGGISNQITNIGDFSYSETNSIGGNAGASYSHGKPAGSLQLTVGKAKVPVKSTENAASADAEKGGQSVSLSGNYGEGDDHSNSIYSDINGDGLTDQILADGSVRLSTGYGYLNTENWGFTNINSGTSKDWGLGAGYSVLSGSFYGGASYSRSKSKSEHSFMDMNSDGLPDKVYYTDTETLVSLNMGNYFDAPIVYPKYASMNENQSVSYGISAGFSFEIPIFLVRLSPSFGTNLGKSTSRSEATYSDIDGDGNMDYILSEGEDQLLVRLSNVKRTNKLKKVTNAAGNSFKLNYELKPSSYENAGAKWVLQEVNLFDGHTGDGVDNLVTRFVYENPYFDRRERDFYGYAKVSQQQINSTDNTIYTTAVQEYYNRDYFRKNLLKTSYSLDAANNKMEQSFMEYAIVNAQDNTTVNEVVLNQPSSDALRVFIAPIHTIEHLYEGASYLEKNTFMEYDAKGNVVKYIDNGNGTTNDKVTAVISYHQSTAPYYDGIAKQIEVFTSEGLKRKRVTSINPTTAEVTQFKMYISANKIAITDIEYDTYGNLKKITAPENYKQQRATVEYTYDNEVFSHIIQIKDVFGYKNAMEYDYRFNAVLKSTDRNDQQMEYTLDDKGRINTIRAPYEIAAGKPYTIAYEYFPFATVPYAKTKNHDPEHNQDIETFTYTDGLGRALQVKKTASLFAGKGIPDTQAHIISGKTIYDAFGRSIESYYPTTAPASANFSTAVSNTSPTKTLYDNKSRPIKVILPDNSTNETEFKVDNFNGIPTILSTNTDALGSQSQSHTDVMGRTVASIQFSAMGNLVTEFQNSALSEISKVIDVNGNVSESSYDWLGRRLVYKHPDAGTTEIEYDLASNMTKRVTTQIKETMPTGGITYEYDYNRLEAIKYPKNPQNNITYHYGKQDGTPSRRGRLWLLQDASGGQEFFYGKLGEVEKEIRTLRITPVDIQTYITQYEYDTWNRIQKMVYPDGEVLDYKYNKAGNLLSMTGEKENHSYNYIKQLGYDTFEQRKFLQYGNDTETNYTYDATTRRLQLLKVNSGTREIMNNNYTYDNVGNVLGIKNTVSVITNTLGGSAEQNYEYDEMYRLKKATGNYTGEFTQADYVLNMSYNKMHNITKKELVHTVNNEQKGYTLNYNYDTAAHPNAPSSIAEVGKPEPRVYEYDGNGNPTTYTEFNSFRKMTWDEENRLMGINDSGRLHIYTYDAQGERVIKSSGDSQNIVVNGTNAASLTHFEEYTAYVSPYFVVSKGKFTKHYFEGADRVTSKLGEGTFKQPLKITAGGLNYGALSALQQQALDNYIASLGVPPGPVAQQGIYATPQATGQPYPGVATQTVNENQEPPEGWPREPVFNTPGDVAGPPVQFGSPIKPTDVQAGEGFVGNGMPENDIFYFHSDHLGSSSYITTINGSISQHVEYIAFGEVLFEEHASSFKTPYLYNGKELDRETNLSYYGARYLDMKTSLWLNVDPLAEEYFMNSSYIYVSQNPMNLIDPTGMGEEGVDDFVQRKDGSIYWDNNANSQATTKVGSGDTWLGKSLSFTFNSFIGSNYDGPLGSLPEGDKLTSKINISATENSKGELTGLTGTRNLNPVGKTMGMFSGRDYYPGEGGSNNYFTHSGTSINYEQHASVPGFEEIGLNSMGYKIVDVAQKLNINYTKSSGNLEVNAYTNVFPSATLKLNNTNTTLMNYVQPSFKATHTAPIKGWTSPSPYKDNWGPRPIRDFSYYPSVFFKRN